uniref:Uncharacterized protein n=1 Tax=Anguilla anguilla TaxID=7936 RepID=A0A0E9UC35_ANGAN
MAIASLKEKAVQHFIYIQSPPRKISLFIIPHFYLLETQTVAQDLIIGLC